MSPLVADSRQSQLRLQTVESGASPREAVSSLYRNRGLLKHLISREVQARYRGSMFGVLWSFINPLIMLAVYAVVFGSIFKSRWGGGSDNVAQFALVLFAGMIVFNLFAECIGRAPTLVTSNTNYVKKVVFPLEILPWVSLGAALFHALISLLVLSLFNLVMTHSIPWTVLLFPIVIAPLAPMIVGVSWILAALGAYIRDIGQVMGLVTSVLMFFSPLFYPVSAVPERYREFIYLNPLTFIIEQAREVLLWGHTPRFTGLLLYTLCGSVFCCVGFFLFQRARKGFADVI